MPTGLTIRFNDDDDDNYVEAIQSEHITGNYRAHAIINDRTE
jgi:thiamine monophosphate synthase